MSNIFIFGILATAAQQRRIYTYDDAVPLSLSRPPGLREIERERAKSMSYRL